MTLYNILQTRDLVVKINEKSHFTIATSPYYAHQHALAIDVYDMLGLENYAALSPIEGKIIEIKKLIAPKPRFKEGVAIDYLTLVRNPKNSRILYKLLHVKPELKVGDSIEIGEIFGKTIRNGYFAPWSSPHIHLEIRSRANPIRASGGLSFTLKAERIIRDIKNKINVSQTPAKLYSIHKEFILIRFPNEFYFNLGQITGLRGHIKDQDGILDGGIPHYKYGMIIMETNVKLKTNVGVFLGNVKIGNIEEVNGQFGIFRCKPFHILFNGENIRGISLLLSKKYPLMKIIPAKGSKLEIQSENYLEFSSDFNTF